MLSPDGPQIENDSKTPTLPDGRAGADKHIGHGFAEHLEWLLVSRHPFSEVIHALQDRFRLPRDQGYNELREVVLWRFAPILERVKAQLVNVECAMCHMRDVRFRANMEPCHNCGSRAIHKTSSLRLEDSQTADAARYAAGVLLTAYAEYVKSQNRLPHVEAQAL